jgi:hypothetical protein
MRRQLRTAVLKAEILEKELHMILKEEAYMMWEMKERENIEAYLRHIRIVTSKHAPAITQ